MITLPQFCIALSAACSLTFGLARWDMDEQVSQQVSIEIRELERYADSWNASLSRWQAFGEVAEAVCGDRVAASQVVRVQNEQKTVARACE